VLTPNAPTVPTGTQAETEPMTASAPPTLRINAQTMSVVHRLLARLALQVARAHHHGQNPR